MYDIITTPHKTLHEKAKPVDKFDKKLCKLVEDMKVTLDHTTDPEGVGLAAPQINISRQIFVAKPTPQAKHQVYINPKITDYSKEINDEIKQSKKIKNKKPKKEQDHMLEGCLSVPRIWGHVKRPKTITLEWQDENGKKYEKKFSGFVATIIQHEIDHLNGILFTKRVLEQNNSLYKEVRDENNESRFEEIEI